MSVPVTPEPRSITLSNDDVAAAALAGLQPMSEMRLRSLLRLGPPSVVLAALAGTGPSPAGLSDVLGARGAPAGLARTLARQAAAVSLERVRHRCERAGVSVRFLGGPDYPAVLSVDPAPPGVLFVRGALPDPARRAVAVVGTRNATSAGLAVATELGCDLAARGVQVVSGLARGIDGAAHRGALAAGGAPPVAVVASGCDVAYPPEHRDLWERVAERGVVVSEVAPGTPPAAHRFPARNRIIAALADVVVVVESRERGGSLITAAQARERGIQVMAVPGSPRNPAAAGTNGLLCDGCAPVADVGDVLVALGLERPVAGPRRRDRRLTPRPEDQLLLELAGTDPVDLDTLVSRSNRTLQEVAMAIGRLEQAGWIAQVGSWLQQVPAPR
jgi:DNA processing protein